MALCCFEQGNNYIVHGIENYRAGLGYEMQILPSLLPHLKSKIKANVEEIIRKLGYKPETLTPIILPEDLEVKCEIRSTKVHIEIKSTQI